MSSCPRSASHGFLLLFYNPPLQSISFLPPTVLVHLLHLGDTFSPYCPHTSGEVTQTPLWVGGAILTKTWDCICRRSLVLSPGCQYFCLHAVLPLLNKCCTLNLMCIQFKPIRCLAGHEDLSVLVSSQKGMEDHYFPKYSERSNSAFHWAVFFSLFVFLSQQLWFTHRWQCYKNRTWGPSRHETSANCCDRMRWQ